MPEIIMPKVGDAMTEGKVVRWYKQAGDKVSKGEPVLEIETDKVNLDLEAEADGTLGELRAKEGQMVPVGETVAQILAPGETAAPSPEPAAEVGGATQRRATDKKDSVKHTTGEYQEAIEQKGPRRDKSQAVPAQNVIAIPVSGGERRRSSPLARRMARDLGVPLESLQGSGPQGRIIAKDVEGAKTAGRIAGATQKLESKSIPLSAMRRTIAKRLTESTGPIPHFYLTVDYDVSQLVSMRQQLADIEASKVSLNDFIIRAVALALTQHPNVNASWTEDAIEQHGEIHIGVAVATAEGLITPVIRNADQKSVSDIAKEVRVLADKAKNRKLLPNEYQGSTFTISSLGAWGIEEFTAIINPPNSAIVAIGAAEQRPVVVNGQIVIRDRMKVTMSCDHRVIDGALGAEFLKTLRQYIEQPLRLMI
ncbi:MAG TPA: dihydrolipoamide acetyltransferase family protein [Thermoanaerobaculia bacterium]|jgi:pyruvate dehydrogenase E2 component (dihydrolipoamide acetyltransferase)|nr:dihydrolipoamide acetyltransferase family protein [Thermoanaerobaculia bacterium]